MKPKPKPKFTVRTKEAFFGAGKFLKNQWNWIVFYLLGGIGIWYLITPYLGDAYTVSYGPEIIGKTPLNLFKLGFTILCTVKVVQLRYPTIYRFCKSSEDGGPSDFIKAWNSVESHMGVKDQRIALSVYTWLGTFIGICLLFAR